MAREDIARQWLSIASKDLEVAELTHNNGYWLYAAFLCHQALEKTLKAYYVATHDDDPPYTHSHMRLLSVCGLDGEVSDTHLRFVDFMVPMYIKARYPEQKVLAARSLNKDTSNYILETTKQLTQWIIQHLPNNRPLTTSEPTNE